MSTNARQWIVDALLGGIAGGVVGAIVAVNLVIYAGIEDGYEASISDIFDENPVVGVLTVAILLGAPFAGVAIARQRRRKRNATPPA